MMLVLSFYPFFSVAINSSTIKSTNVSAEEACEVLRWLKARSKHRNNKDVSYVLRIQTRAVAVIEDTDRVRGIS
jgi:hypothetical protein